ncbi:cytosolic endo-beta-N-acetylglucosaminidase [Harmonia axyridis]|uniref:cytosolic endo-beta-N-acetylglucosaminidase n=1 Tax=Harmonia axyridis TaxID=115357 RepID=UPI001E275012|nr:cytosolic endo-beta-N-acetylglucosaminidase [Harmonia axyridis]
MNSGVDFEPAIEGTIIENEKKEQIKEPLMPLWSECGPLKSLEELDIVIDTPPAWLSNIIPLEKRDETVVQNVLSDCHSKISNYQSRPRLDAKFVPKTLVCHDYKGGYLEDRHLIVELDTGNQYTFYNWSHIDIFVYFSHNFITIPPLCWINAAHQKGVKILGTFITEWDEGIAICKDIFKDMSTMQSLIKKLCKITEMFKLDGWLLNIENKLEDTTILKEFVKELTEQLHSINDETLVIWYDSILENGKLLWQNELNEKNLCFFERCDGIFLNYVWTEETLLQSIKMAKERSLDIYVGIDIFGRNTFGGGHFNTYKAAEVIRRHGLSMAIFAPGWTHESIVHTEKDSISLMEHFFNKDCAFWNSLWPYLYTHPITKYFQTSFYKGAASNRFSISLQETQLSKIVHPKYSYLVPNYAEIPTLERKCHCIRLDYNDDTCTCLINKQGMSSDIIIHNLFICNIEASGEVIVYFKKKCKPFGILGLRILTCLKNGSRHVITLNGRKKEKLIQNCSVTQVNPLSEETDLFKIFKKQQQVVEGDSEIMVYTFSIGPSYILEIGAILEEGDAVCLESFGIEPSGEKNIVLNKELV